MATKKQAAAKKPLKVGVIGLGRSGYNIHIKRMRGDDRFEISAVSDFIPERMEEVNAEFGSAMYGDYKEMLKECDCDVVVVATYSHTHAPVAKEVLKAGYHCICEKPIADSVQMARSVVTAAEKAKKKVMFHHNRHFLPDALHLKDIIDRKVIGDVFEIRMRALGFSRRNDWQTFQKFDGGVLNNTCPHFIETGLELLDAPVKDIFCDLKHMAAAGDAEDHVKVILRGENGRVYDMEVSSVCKFSEPMWTVLGSCGTLVSDGKESTIEYFDPKKLQPLEAVETPTDGRTYANDDKIPWKKKTVKSVGPDIGDFYDNVWAVLRERRKMIVPPERALEVVRVTQACKRMSGFYE